MDPETGQTTTQFQKAFDESKAFGKERKEEMREEKGEDEGEKEKREGEGEKKKREKGD